MAVRRISRKAPSYMARADHVRLWTHLENAMVETFKAHPDYLTEHGQLNAVASLTKRAVGAVIHLAKQTREGERR